MRIVNKVATQAVKRVKTYEHPRGEALSLSKTDTILGFTQENSVSLLQFFQQSLFLKLEKILMLLKETQGKSTAEKNIPVIKRAGELINKLQSARQYSISVVKHGVELFSELAKLRAMPVQFFTEAESLASLSREIKAVKEFFEHFQMYESLNRDYEGKTFLAFPLFNLFKKEKDIQVFLYLERNKSNHEEPMQFFSFRLDVPTEYLGQVGIWGKLRSGHIHIEIEVESEKYLAYFKHHQSRLKDKLSQHKCILEKLLVRQAKSKAKTTRKGVEFIV